MWLHQTSVVFGSIPSSLILILEYLKDNEVVFILAKHAQSKLFTILNMPICPLEIVNILVGRWNHGTTVLENMLRECSQMIKEARAEESKPETIWFATFTLAK